jgi:hypothetical protein
MSLKTSPADLIRDAGLSLFHSMLFEPFSQFPIPDIGSRQFGFAHFDSISVLI